MCSGDVTVWSDLAHLLMFLLCSDDGWKLWRSLLVIYDSFDGDSFFLRWLIITTRLELIIVLFAMPSSTRYWQLSSSSFVSSYFFVTRSIRSTHRTYTHNSTVNKSSKHLPNVEFNYFKIALSTDMNFPVWNFPASGCVTKMLNYRRCGLPEIHL